MGDDPTTNANNSVSKNVKYHFKYEINNNYRSKVLRIITK